MLTWVFRNVTPLPIALGDHTIRAHFFIELDHEDVSAEMRKRAAALVKQRSVHVFLVDDGRPVHEMNEVMILQKYDDLMNEESRASDASE